MKAGFTLDPNEQIVRQVNRHWIDLAPAMASVTALVLVVIAIAYGYGRYRDQLTFVPGAAVALLVAILALMGGLIFVSSLWVYRQNRLLLTNLHLIQIEQRGLFGRRVSQLSLARVQDVSGQRNGMWATLLNYGDVVVQSAGEEEKFVFRTAPDPQELADVCMEAHEGFVHERPDAELRLRDEGPGRNATPVAQEPVAVGTAAAVEALPSEAEPESEARPQTQEGAPSELSPGQAVSLGRDERQDGLSGSDE